MSIVDIFCFNDLEMDPVRSKTKHLECVITKLRWQRLNKFLFQLLVLGMQTTILEVVRTHDLVMTCPSPFVQIGPIWPIVTHSWATWAHSQL